LAVTEYGPEGGAPVVVLHGLFGSARNWTTVCRRLAEHHHVLAPDLRNHGASPWSDEMTYDAMAGDVIALLEELSQQASLVGHSMGGKAAMLVALRRPDLLRRLVVVDVAPVAYESTFDAYARAMLGVELAGVTRRAEVDAAIAPEVPDPGVRAFLLQNLAVEAGRATWRPNLFVLEREMGTVSGFPLVPAWARFERPTMFVAGGQSDYIQPDHADKVLELFPKAEVRVVPDAGHWVHAERLEDFLALLVPFLSEPAATS